MEYANNRYSLSCSYVKTTHSVVLDYAVNVHQLSEEDQVLGYGELGNFSVAGFEMVLNRWAAGILNSPLQWLRCLLFPFRHISHYLITYYLPSGQFWITKTKDWFWWDLNLNSTCFQVYLWLFLGSVLLFRQMLFQAGWLFLSLCSLFWWTSSILWPPILQKLRVSGPTLSWELTCLFNSGLTAIEAWMLSCILFVFGALVGEFLFS